MYVTFRNSLSLRLSPQARVARAGYLCPDRPPVGYGRMLGAKWVSCVPQSVNPRLEMSSLEPDQFKSYVRQYEHTWFPRMLWLYVCNQSVQLKIANDKIDFALLSRELVLK